jgi:uncharacterized protein YqjF (DUF2071 family)
MNNWIMSQTWKDVAFLHYQVDPELLQSKVPFKLDLYRGKAIISIVSFRMESIRFPFLLTFPGLSSLNELNLRTYVEVNGIKGVYFFTLDADHSLAIWIARTLFSLPYRPAKINLNKQGQIYSFNSLNEKTSLDFEALISEKNESSHFDLWATERYGLFTKKGENIIHGVVMHQPWELESLTITNINDQFSSQLGDSLKAESFISSSYCKKLEVRFKPFYCLREQTC